ncbi:MAG: Rab family GTPase [Promethearchaeota archaeon]
MSRGYTTVMKLVMVGDPGVGKTSLVARYVEGKFMKDYHLTVGLNVSSKTVQLSDDYGGITVKISINDIGGQKRFQSLRSVFYRGAYLAMLVYDVTRPRTLTNLQEMWFKELLEYCDLDIPPVTLLVGNKADLKDMMMVEEEEIKEAMKDMNSVMHIHTSAKDNINVTEAFVKLCEAYITKQKQ